MSTDLLVPDEAITAVRRLGGASAFYDTLTESEAEVRAIAAPVVVAELLALAGNVLHLPAPDGVDRDGFDAARWAFREMIADRCDELGTRVEDL